MNPLLSCFALAGSYHPIRHFLPWTTLACLLGIHLPARADDSHNMEQILVTAVQEQQTAPDFQVFDHNELNRGFSNLGDFLQQVNGMQVQTLGGLGDPALVSIRGASASQTRLLVNGIAVNNGQYGHYDLNAIPLNQIERIEILQSSADASSGLISDDAIGGTINIVTRSQLDGSTRISTSLGSANTRAVSIAQPSGSHNSLTYDHQQSDNNFVNPVPSPWANPANQDEHQALNNNRYERNSLLLSHQRQTVTAQLQVQDEYKQIPDYFRNSPNNHAALASRSGYLQLDGDFRLGQKQPFYQHWQLFQSLRHEQYRDPQGILGQTEDNNRYRYQQSSGRFSSQTNIRNWTFSTGLEASEQTYQSRYLLDTDASDCSSLSGNCNQFSWQQDWQASAQARWQGDKGQQLTLSSGHHQQNSLSRPSGDTSLATTRDQRAWPSWLLQYRQEYALTTSNLWWQLGLKRALRTPSLYERYGDHGLMIGNNSLEPELSHSQTLDSGINGQLLGRPHRLTLTLFKRDLDNAIIALYDDTGAGRYENTSSAELQGLEWQLNSQLTARRQTPDSSSAQSTDNTSGSTWNLKLGGSHYRSLTHSDDVKSLDQKELAGIYHLRLLASLDWLYQTRSNERYNLQLSGELADGLWLDRSNLSSGDPRRLLNLSGSYQFGSITSNYCGETGLRISNLTNHFFHDYTDRPTNGRQWSLYLTLNL